MAAWSGTACNGLDVAAWSGTACQWPGRSRVLQAGAGRGRLVWHGMQRPGRGLALQAWAWTWSPGLALHVVARMLSGTACNGLDAAVWSGMACSSPDAAAWSGIARSGGRLFGHCAMATHARGHPVWQGMCCLGRDGLVRHCTHQPRCDGLSCMALTSPDVAALSGTACKGPDVAAWSGMVLTGPDAATLHCTALMSPDEAALLGTTWTGLDVATLSLAHTLARTWLPGPTRHVRARAWRPCLAL